MADSNQHQLEGEIFHEDLIFLSIQMVTWNHLKKLHIA
jgi:hypothetical protein